MHHQRFVWCQLYLVPNRNQVIDRDRIRRDELRREGVALSESLAPTQRIRRVEIHSSSPGQRDCIIRRLRAASCMHHHARSEMAAVFAIGDFDLVNRILDGICRGAVASTDPKRSAGLCPMPIKQMGYFHFELRTGTRRVRSREGHRQKSLPTTPQKVPQSCRISSRCQKINCLQNRRLAAVVGANQQIHPSETRHVEARETAISFDV